MTRKYNILYTINSLWGAGAELVLSNLMRYLDKSRFNVFLCQLQKWGEHGETLRRQGYNVVCIRPAVHQGPYYGSAFRLHSYAEDHAIDLIHSHDLQGLIDGALCRRLKLHRRFMHTFHYGNYPNLPKKYLALEALCARAADQLISVGHVQRQMLRRTYKLKQKAITTIWNGVESPRIDEAECPSDLNFKHDGRLIIGSISTMTAQKGIPDLLRVAARMRDLQDKCHFVIAGAGPLENYYRKLCHKMQLDSFITFTGWVKNAANIMLPHFDIFLQTSLWEAMSMVILEAMAAGKPIIATAVGENPQILKDGDTALLVLPGNEIKIESALRILIQRPELRQTLGHASFKAYSRWFTVDRMVRQYEDLYLHILQDDGKCC